MSNSVNKIVAERNRRTLLELVLKPGNDTCADCKARAPRWASYNLGIFLCVTCASIHRKIGTHITKVKSITLDEWTKEQVEVMKEKGNVKSNALYNPNEAHYPPPTNMLDLERDSDLEKFIRSKYEFKRFVSQKPGPNSQHLMVGSLAVPRSWSTPLTDSASIDPPGPPLPPKTPENLPSKLRPKGTIPSPNAPPMRSFSQPLPFNPNSEKLSGAAPLRQYATSQSTIQKPAGGVWEDLVSLQEPSQSSSLPLQYSPASPFTTISSQQQMSMQQHPATFGAAPNPFMSLSLGQSNLVASPMSLSTPSPQFPYPSPFSSPALSLGAPNPFSQAPSSNPFASPVSMSMATSTPTMPVLQPVMGFPTGTLLYTPPAQHMSTPAAPFAPGPTVGSLAPKPFAPIGPPGQMPLSASGASNPFMAMQAGQAGFSGASPHGTTAFVGQQQPQQLQQPGPHAFGGWAAHGAPGTF